MKKAKNRINKYLTEKEILIFKRLLINILFDAVNETDLGYYYSLPKISNIINKKVEKIFVSEDNIVNLLALQDKILILDRTFENIDFNKEELINIISKEEYLLIRIKEFGLNLIGNNKLNPNFKSALAIYFANNKAKSLNSFYNRKYYTSLPFMDLKESVISSLNIFVGNDILAQTLCLGDLQLSNKLDQISNHRGTLKNIIKFLDKITMIQNKIVTSNLKYFEVENIYFNVLTKINILKKLNTNMDRKELVEELYDTNYELLDKEIQRKLIAIMRVYDLWNMSNIEEKKERQMVDNSFNYTILKQDKDFVSKLEIILNLIKEDIYKTLKVLDKEYIKLNDFIVNNLLSKYLKNKKFDDYNEIANIFRNLEYEIENEYNYLEQSKASKKLKKRLEKNDRH